MCLPVEFIRKTRLGAVSIMASNHGLGVDPLDALLIVEPVGTVGSVPSVGAVGAVPSSGEAKAPRRRDEPVKLAAVDVDQARAAVRFLNLNGQPDETLKGLLTRALRAEVLRLAGEYNNGEPFPTAGALARGGRVRVDTEGTEPTQ